MGQFDIALRFALSNEGTHYVADPSDKGVCSRMGVTLASLSSWRGKPCTCDDVAKLGIDEVTSLYRLRYWDAMQLDQIGPQATATALFDMGVLNGPKEAVKVMQSCVHLLEDGILGPKTLAAINSHTASFLVPLFAQMFQLHFLQICRKDPSQAKFVGNWVHRAGKLLLLAI